MMVVSRADKDFRRGQARGRSSVAAARDKGRAKQRVRSLLRMGAILLIASAVVAGTASAYKAVADVRYFTVKTITVSGLDKLDARRVRGIVTPILSGNIFTRDIDRATKLLEQFPEVDTASIRLKLPDVAEVTVTERRPAAAVAMNGKTFLMDSKSVLIEEAKGQPAAFLIKGLAGTGTPGEVIADPRLADVFRIVSLFALDTQLHDAPVAMDVTSPSRIEVQTAAGHFLRFGPDRDQWEEKFYEYLSARNISADMGAHFIGWDLSFRDQVIGIRDNNQPSTGGKENRG